MASITIFGGTGYAGSAIAREAVARGHAVTVVARKAPADPIEGVAYVTGSALDPAVRAAALDGADVAISTLAPRGDMAGKVREVDAALATEAAASGVRLGVVGGAGSLFVAEGGPRLYDTPEFPADYKDESLELAAVLDDLRAARAELDWFYISPAAEFGAFAPGERTGSYRVSDDVLLTSADGHSSISGADLGVAFVDEIEKPAHVRSRFTVAY